MIHHRQGISGSPKSLFFSLLAPRALSRPRLNGERSSPSCAWHRVRDKNPNSVYSNPSTTTPSVRIHARLSIALRVTKGLFRNLSRAFPATQRGLPNRCRRDRGTSKSYGKTARTQLAFLLQRLKEPQPSFCQKARFQEN